MPLRPLAWLLLPLAGLVELASHAYFAYRPPSVPEWSQVRAEVEQAARPGDLVVVAPAWAEPIARQALGEGLMPLADVARLGNASYSHALELSILGQHAGEFSDWIEIERVESDKFTLRRLLNPKRVPVVYAFNDHAEPPELQVIEWNGEAQHECEYTTKARSSAGGLGGHVTYPRERYRCSGGDPFLVGLTVIDDKEYRPRRCIYAHPKANSWLLLRFLKVPVGKKIGGAGGMSYLIARDGTGLPVEFAVYIDNKEIGRRLFEDQKGFDPFEFSFEAGERKTVDVTFEIQSKQTAEREFCFTAEMR